MPMVVFIINPGSTSTKVALFKDEQCCFSKTIRHDSCELDEFPTAVSQMGYRFEIVRKIICEDCPEVAEADAFVGRGGLIRPLDGGTYIVSPKMLEELNASKYGDHASNLGALIASALANEYGKEAYIANPPVVDELMDEARLTGLPEIRRTSVFHALNQKAVARSAAEESGMIYENARFIVAHLGGGISIGVHDRGRVVDVSNAIEEGPFSPERAGNLPSGQLVDLCFSGKFTKKEIKRKLVGKGGFVAYAGTSDFLVLVKEYEEDATIRLLLDAFVYRVSREICAGAAALYGNIDRILITGGLAHNYFIVEKIKERISFLGPVSVFPGEDEMAALADASIRVLDGREKALIY